MALGIARRQQESDIARAGMSRMMRLAYLSPDVLERLLLWREPPALSLTELIKASYLPWSEQMEKVFDGPSTTAPADA